MTAPEPIGIVFDLDDTLYLERDYAFSGFEAVGEWLQREHGLEGFARQARSFFAQASTRVFDRALKALGMPAPAALIEQLVSVYRGHTPHIALAPDAASFLQRWHAGWPLAILTDGFHQSQRNKVDALGLDGTRFRPIVYTDEWGRAFWKPHLRGFQSIAEAFGLPPGRMVYVADNPAKDFIAPRALGWRTVQIARPEGVHIRNPVAPGGHPDATIQSLDELDTALLANPSAHAA